LNPVLSQDIFQSKSARLFSLFWSQVKLFQSELFEENILPCLTLRSASFCFYEKRKKIANFSWEVIPESKGLATRLFGKETFLTVRLLPLKM